MKEVEFGKFEINFCPKASCGPPYFLRTSSQHLALSSPAPYHNLHNFQHTLLKVQPRIIDELVGCLAIFLLPLQGAADKGQKCCLLVTFQLVLHFFKTCHLRH